MRDGPLTRTPTAREAAVFVTALYVVNADGVITKLQAPPGATWTVPTFVYGPCPGLA